MLSDTPNLLRFPVHDNRARTMRATAYLNSFSSTGNRAHFVESEKAQEALNEFHVRTIL